MYELPNLNYILTKRRMHLLARNANRANPQPANQNTHQKKFTRQATTRQMGLTWRIQHNSKVTICGETFPKIPKIPTSSHQFHNLDFVRSKSRLTENISSIQHFLLNN